MAVRKQQLTNNRKPLLLIFLLIVALISSQQQQTTASMHKPTRTRSANAGRNNNDNALPLRSFSKKLSLSRSSSFDDESSYLSLSSIERLSTIRGGAVSRRGQTITTKKSISKTKQTASPNKKQHGGGQASMAASVFNLVNNVAGAGILALSAGQAAGTGWIPSILICIALGVVSTHTFTIVGEACDLASCSDFKVSISMSVCLYCLLMSFWLVNKFVLIQPESVPQPYLFTCFSCTSQQSLWAFTLGENTTFLVDLFIAVLCLACSVIYSGILGDVFTPLLAQIGVPDKYNSRSTNIVFLTIAALLPLSLIKNLSALAFTSVLGFSAIIYTVLFVVVRALDGSYALETGRFVTDGVLPSPPSFERSSLWNVDFTSLVLASSLGLAFIAHCKYPIPLV